MSECVKQATYEGIEVLTVAECRQIAASKLKSENVDVLDVKTAPLSETRAGYLGDHYLVTITASSDGNQTTYIKVFVKTITNSAMHDLAVQTGGHKKEAGFFSVMMNDLMKYNGDEKENDGILEPVWTAGCYLTTESKIVLEDLSVNGFKNHGRSSLMDKEHCAVVLQTLARFHASSYIFEEKETQRIGVACRMNKIYPDQFNEVMWVSEEDHPCRKMCEAGMICSSELFKCLPGVKEDEGRHKDLVERMWESYMDICSMMAAASEGTRNVVSQGDMWSNNILISYDENEKPVDAKLVDFQLLRYTVPANDFLSFLHLNTRRHLRDQHLLDLARTYHATLRAELSRHHLDVEDILPWEEFKASLEKYREMAAFGATIYFPFVLMDPKVMAMIVESPEVFKKFMFESRSEEVSHCFKTEPVFKNMMTECLEELIELLKLRQK